MRKIIVPIILLLCICCCKAPRENSSERVDNSNMVIPSDVVVIKDSIESSDDFYAPDMNIPSDVVIIKDSFPMCDDYYGHEKEYFVSRNYIGFRYANNQDTVIEEPVPKFSPKVMKEIHSYGKDIIPYLISQIDRGKMGSSNFVNPYESNLGRVDLHGGPLGINYAYMIELILAKDSIKDNYVYEGGYDTWYEKMKPYKIYGHCKIIEKKDLNNPNVLAVSSDDMKTIKSVYNKWWQSNKNESLESLRKKWREEGSPLQKSSYMWI